MSQDLNNAKLIRYIAACNVRSAHTLAISGTKCLNTVGEGRQERSPDPPPAAWAIL